MSILSERFVVFDLETTNAPERNYKHEIIEIAAIAIEKGKIITDNAFHSLVRPPCKIQPHNFRVSGISDSMVENAPTVKEILPGFISFIGNNPLIAHGMSFDAKVLKEQMSALGYGDLPNTLIDTLALSKKIYKGEKKHALEAVVQRLDIAVPKGKTHRALTDAECTAIVFLKFLAILEQHAITSLEDIIRLCTTNCDIRNLRQTRLF